MAKLVLDVERCKGCLLCTEACPKGLLKKGEAFNKQGYYTVVLIRPGECKGCTLCAEVCPDIAIEVWK
jgi:2-oxoglutarate ferredoxin oxidoreductase subunit delta